MKKPERTKVRTVHGIQCPICEERLWSKYRHDFHYCECGYCFIYGGQHDYHRYGWGFNSEDWYADDWESPALITFSVPDNRDSY